MGWTDDRVKFELDLKPGLSDHLAGWEATILVGARGSLRCRWIGDGELQDREVRRHRFPLDAPAFARLSAELRSIPEDLHRSQVTDAPVRRICLVDEGASLERSRSVIGTPTPGEAAFDRVWMELFALVRPVLVEVGMPEDALRNAC